MRTELDRVQLRELYAKIQGCPVCHGKDLSCSCYRTYRREVNKINANVPRKFRKSKFEDIKEPKLNPNVKIIKKYVNNLRVNFLKGLGLYLYGPPGTGKSCLGNIVLMHALEKGYSCYCTTITDYLDIVTGNASDYPEQDLKTGYTFLLLDNVGREYRDKGKEFVLSQIDDLLGSREKAFLPTIIVASQNYMDTFADRASLASLIPEHFVVLQFPNCDYRKEIEKQRKDEKEEKKDQ